MSAPFLKLLESLFKRVQKSHEYLHLSSEKCFIAITMNSIQFAKSVVIFAEDLLKLFTTELEDFIAEAIATVYRAQVKHIEDSLKNEGLAKEVTDEVLVF